MAKKSAKEYAVSLLSVCDRSEKEIREKLSGKGYGSEESEEAVAMCMEYGYIDDLRFARRFAHDASEIKRLGKAKIKSELRRKGVDEEICNLALENLGDDGEILKSEMKRRFREADFSDAKVRNKVFGFFARRGFSAGDIIEAMGDGEYFD